MDGQSLDILSEKLSKLKELYPEVFTEDKIDWEKLQATLGNQINLSQERYHLNWAGKSEVFRILQQRTSATLIPVQEESTNFNETENIFIEGENLEVLKVLQKSYFNKIKVIYIDPPYNTGSDSFIYPDRFAESKDDYLKRIGDKDEEGLLLKEGMFRKNSKDSGHYHSNWLSMMYPRLYLARNLLRDDGVIFVSIDDNEIHNLRMIMNEIYGEENFLAQFIWRTDGNFDNQAKVKNCHEYFIAYCKELNQFPHPPVIDPSIPPSSKLYTDEIRNTIVKNGIANPISNIVLPKGFPADFEEGIIHSRSDKWPYYLNDANVKNYKLQNDTTISSGWSSKELIEEYIANNLNSIIDGKGQETSFIISKTGAVEVIKQRKSNQSHVISVITNLGNTQNTSAKLKSDGIFFDFPKPVILIKYLFKMNEGNDFIVLDFFAGSGTTAQAVIELNKEDGGNRKFILVQLPEKTDENSEAYKAGYKTIADICKERIRRVIKKINTPVSNNPSFFQGGGVEGVVGFNVFKLAPSNFKIWRSDVIENTEDLEKMIDIFDDQVKPNAEKENMLYELILKSGYPLTVETAYMPSNNGGYYSINNKETIILLESINQIVIDEILKLNPKNVIALDKLFSGNDQLKTNTVLQMKDTNIEFRTV